MKHRLFPIGSFAGYMLIDFATIAFSIMASYKFYRVMGFGQNVYYAKLGIIPLSLLLSLGVVFVLFIFGAYKNESSLLNVSEIKSVVKGISLGFPLFAIKQYRIDEICLAISNISNETCIKILERLKKENVRISFIPNLYRVFVHRVNINHIGQIPIVEEDQGEVGKVYLAIKRCSDILMAIILTILLSHVFLAAAVAIKMDSKGPVFFKQKRVGIHGGLFEIFKFRSMTTESDPYAVNPTGENDARVTKVGRFLRKTSLDELPQLFNVLKGDMSFVGPRPEMPFIVASYSDIHRERLKVLPGITGLWQLSGDREKAIHENMDYDLYYLKNRSLFLDVAILLETLLFAFKEV
jgi:exopolysaccharide biosynthesis polyprenyl glycosylphosphotransferase